MTNKVVLTFKDGKILKGLTNNFFPNKNTFHLSTEDGQITEINREDLKAIFFVKDYSGNKARKDMYDDHIPGAGRKIQVMFKDNEVITGFCQGYSSERPGFFIVPAAKEGNNERIFIVSSATATVKFL